MSDFICFDSDPLPQNTTADGRYERIPCPVLFRCGDYPDKKFSLTLDEAKVALKDFQPLNLDLEHKPSVFDGKLGKLATIKLDEANKTFSGEVVIPKWAHEVLPKDKRGLSLSFDPKTKRIRGCSLVVNPRINDAGMQAMFAAFSADLLKGGDLPEAPVTPTPPISGDVPQQAGPTTAIHGADLAQKLYDMLVKAKEDADKAEGVYNPKYVRTLEKLMEMAKELGAEGAAPTEKPKSEKEDEKGGGNMVGTGANEPSTNMSGFSKEAIDEITRLKAEAAAKDKAYADLQDSKIEADAVSFAESMIPRKAVPAQRADLISLYKQAAKSDLVTFSTTKQQGTMVQALKSMMANSPDLNLTSEQFRTSDGPQDLPAEFSRNPSKESDPSKIPNARIDALLSHTELGRMAVNGRRRK